MKISQQEIDAALSAFNAFEFAYREGTQGEAMEVALAAGLMARKRRKASKRERQRKEKDKQVVESVKGIPIESGMNEAERAVFECKTVEMMCDLSTPSKAPEWDGTFGVGNYEMRDGRMAVINEVVRYQPYPLIGRTPDAPHSWGLDGRLTANKQASLDLIRPWPKGEQ